MPIPHIQKGSLNYTYFLTITVVEWMDIFTSTKYLQVLLDSLKYCQKEKGLIVIAYVFMTNHLHLVLSNSQNSLDNILRDFKRHTTKSLKELLENDHRTYMLEVVKRHNGSIWQQDNYPELVESDKFLQQKIKYIHNNPVKKGLVKKPEDWIFSSASNYFSGQGLLSITKY